MTKNRDYTGLVRTPSSMAWLIRQRARLQGKINRLEEALQDLPEEIAELQAQLDRLDGIFPLHEVAVDPSVIAPIQPRRAAIAPRGVMTRAIYECLREGKDRGPLYTTEVTIYFARMCGIEMDNQMKVYLTVCVGRRLKVLAREGELTRHHSLVLGNREEGRWSLRI